MTVVGVYTDREGERYFKESDLPKDKQYILTWGQVLARGCDRCPDSEYCAAPRKFRRGIIMVEVVDRARK